MKTNVVFNEDCLLGLKSLPDESVHVCITDPPYFIHGMGNGWNVSKLKEKTSKADVIKSMPVGMKFDPQQGRDFEKFMNEVSKEIYRVLKPGGFFISFSQGRLYHRMAVAIEDAGFEIRDLLIWKRSGQAKAFTQDHFVRKMDLSNAEKEDIIASLDGRKTPQLKTESEPMVLAQKPKIGTFVENWMAYEVGLIDVTHSLDGKFPGTVMDVAKPGTKDRVVKHFTVKPVPLISHLINIFSKENQIVLDPFMGSFTSAIAALETNRKYIGFELDEEYFQLGSQRVIAWHSSQGEDEDGTD